MKVLYVAQNYQPMNASSITTHEIIKKLAEKGYKTTLLVPRRCPKECIPGCSLECGNNVGFTVVRTPTFVPYYVLNRSSSMRALVLGFCRLFLILRGLRIMKRKNFDVVVSQHHPSHFASFSAFILSRIFKLPLVIKTHDVYNSTSGIIQLLFFRLLDNLHRIVFKYADLTLVVSGPLRSEMIKTYKLNKHKVLVFPNGVDAKKFRPDVKVGSLRRDLQVEGRKVMLFIGRVREERGLALIIRALPQITAENSNVTVLIVGGGPQKHYVENLVEKLHVERFVRFLQPICHNEIPKYICLSDLAIGPLVANIDTFGSVPRKVLEYMACAKPVITCHGGVSEDLIVDRYNGFLFNSSRVGGLAPTIVKVINRPKLVKEVGLNARKYVEKFHNWDRIIGKFERALNTVSTRRVKIGRREAG